jgi:hypothetical protein
MATIEATPGYRMNVLIRRRSGVTRDELVANWFANHMPAVVRRMEAHAREGKPHARRYIATLFDPPAQGPPAWDGMAQLWWKANLPKPKEPIGTKPADTFQQKVSPYMPWMVREYVVLDGALPVTPNTLNDPFPFTRSGFFKVTFLIKTKPGVDNAAFVRHYLEVHAPNGARAIAAAGGYRYVVAHSVDPQNEEFASHAEVWFADAEGWARSQGETKPDGIEQFIDAERSLVFTSGTEMVGIPG